MKIMKKFMIIIVMCLIFNGISFAYFNPAHGAIRNSYRLEPNTIGVNAVEGFGILYSDKNGFPNVDLPLIEEGYILAMGSSQTKADQVMVNERYSDLLNQYLGYEDELGVYNLGYSGGLFWQIVKNFKQLIQEFPNSKYVIIEVADGQLNVSDDLYFEAMQQVDIEDCVYGEELGKHDTIGKIKRFIKLYCPLLLLYVNQYSQWNKFVQANQKNQMVFEIETEKQEVMSQEEKYREMLKLMDEQYTGEIIVLYHNGFELDSNDNYVIQMTERKKDFLQACKENKIHVIDMDTVWEKSFKESHIIPYGFNNTSLESGHLNKYGHELIAKEIYKYIGLD